MRSVGERRRPSAPAAAAALLLLPLCGISDARGESIYYQTGEDGTIRLTNAPGSGRYHTFLASGRSPGLWGGTPGLFSEPIRLASRKFGVDPDLVRAVIAAESSFDPTAVSPKGARGLMQLMPSTASRFGVRDVFDPVENIFGGVRYLRHLLDLFGGDLVLALAAYNAGEKAVLDRGGVPGFPETVNYVDRVLSGYHRRGKTARASSPRDSQVTGPSRSVRKARIYRAVSGDGALVFSDSPIPKPARD